jgi:hypothetical protein
MHPMIMIQVAQGAHIDRGPCSQYVGPANAMLWPHAFAKKQVASRTSTLHFSCQLQFKLSIVWLTGVTGIVSCSGPSRYVFLAQTHTDRIRRESYGTMEPWDTQTAVWLLRMDPYAGRAEKQSARCSALDFERSACCPTVGLCSRRFGARKDFAHLKTRPY